MAAKAKDVKNFLKTKQIDTKNIRVSTDSSIRVKLLDPYLDLEKIETILQEEFESYQRDEATGEILSGGNTFVFVEYDWDLVKRVQEELHGTIKPFLEKCSGNWSIQLLVNHYLEQKLFDYNDQIIKRAVRESFYSFFRHNENENPNLKVEGWNI